MTHAANDGCAGLSNEHTVMEQEDSDEGLDGSDFEIFSSSDDENSEEDYEADYEEEN